ncbi:MAG: Gfo/Idh/MocA family oxidoreductase [Conexivisphaerales archaeon]
MKIGIIGLGKMGILHAGILNALPSCSVVAICEKETLLRRAGSKLLKKIKFYGEVEDMMEGEEELDAVYVTTPISIHLPIIEQIAKTEKKVGLFVEKPLAGSYSDAQRLFEVASRLTDVHMIGFQKRFSPIFQKAKTFLDEGVLGELNFFRAYSFSSDILSEGKGWRFNKGAGGAMLDLGPHLIDLLLWYFDEPTILSSFSKSFYSKEVEDFVHASLKFQNGLAGYLDVSWSMDGYRLPETKIEIIGSQGKLEVSDDYLRLHLRRSVNGIEAGRHEFKRPDLYKGVTFLLGDPEYCSEDEHFVNCLKEKKEPVINLKSGVLVNKIIEEIKSNSS